MAVLEFLAAATGARIIASDMRKRIFFLRKGFLLSGGLSFLLSRCDFFRFRLANLNIHQNTGDVGTDRFKQVGIGFPCCRSFYF